MFDPKTENDQRNGSLPTPWSAPYDAVFTKRGEAWTGSMMNDQVARLDTTPARFVEYLLPRTTNIRRVFVDDSGPRPAFWAGSNHGASIVKARAARLVENAKVSVMSLVFKTLAGALAVIALAHTAQAQGVISERNVSTQLGAGDCDAAMECAPMASDSRFAVVDRAGQLRVLMRGDDTPPRAWSWARRKAYTARAFRRSSLEWAKRTETELAGQRSLAEVIPLGGGRADPGWRRHHRGRRCERTFRRSAGRRHLRQGCDRQSGRPAQVTVSRIEKSRGMRDAAFCQFAVRCAVAAVASPAHAQNLKQVRDDRHPGRADQSVWQPDDRPGERTWLSGRQDNKGVVVFDTKSDTFVSRSPASSAWRKRQHSGPNGIVVVNGGAEVWVSDGDKLDHGDRREIRRGQSQDCHGRQVARQRHGLRPNGKVVIVANSNDAPPFLSLISPPNRITRSSARLKSRSRPRTWSAPPIMRRAARSTRSSRCLAPTRRRACWRRPTPKVESW